MNIHCKDCRYYIKKWNVCLIHDGLIGNEHRRNVLAYGECDEFKLAKVESPVVKKDESRTQG